MAGGFTRRAALCLALSVVAPGARSADAAVAVRVGAYEFPPYVTDSGPGVTQGLIDLFNESQPDYRFELVRTSPQRRYDDMAQGRFDLIAFESRAWGWQDRPVEATRVFFRDAEVFVARAGPGAGQTVFDRLEGKTILGRLGYHYAFAGFNSDPKVLERRYNTRVTVTHEGNLRSVAAGRADLAIVTRSFLNQMLRADPALAGQLLVSERTDQTYEHTILARRGGPVGASWLNALLDRLEGEGKLAELWSRYGIQP